MSGVSPSKTRASERIISDKDGSIAVWAGAIDDLWSLGKPKGKGGPWYRTKTAGGEISDPYLLGGYDQRKLAITNHGNSKLSIKLQIDPAGTGEWYDARGFTVAGEKTVYYDFPASLQGKWLRFVSISGGEVTTQLEYY